MQQHQTHDGQVPRGAEAGPEAGHLIDRQRHHDAFGFLHAQPAQRRTRTAEAQRRTPPIEMVKTGCEGAGRIGKLVAQRTIHDAHAAVDGGGRGLGLMAGLESEVVRAEPIALSALSLMASVWFTLAHQRRKCSRSMA